MLASWSDEPDETNGPVESLALAVRGMLEYYEDGLSCMQSEGHIDGNEYDAAFQLAERATAALEALTREA